MIVFYDISDTGTSPLGGGYTLVIGYEYVTGDFGFQLAMKFAGTLSKRAKNNANWTDWTNV